MIADRFSRSESYTPDNQSDYSDELESEKLRGVLRDSVSADFFYSAKMGEKATRHLFMLRSILYQMLDKDHSLYSLFKTIYRRLSDVCTDEIVWSMYDLQNVFERLVTDRSPERKRLVCILGGFDESEGPGDSIGQVTTTTSKSAKPPLLNWFCGLATGQGKGSWLKLIVLSRPEAGITRALGPFPEIILEEHNKKTISTIIDTGLRSIKETMLEWEEADGSPGEWESQADEILSRARSQMLERADGTIQWVVSVLKELQAEFQLAGSMRIVDLESILNSLPKGLEELYKELVNRLRRRQSPKQRGRAREMLMWACFAQRPLTSMEFRDALALQGWQPGPLGQDSFQQHLEHHRFQIDHLKRDILDTCGCLLEVVKPTSANLRGFPNGSAHTTRNDGAAFIVQVTHETVKEFLTRSDHIHLPLTLDPESCRHLIADALACYMVSSIPMPEWQGPAQLQDWGEEDFQHLAKYLEDRPLLHYIIESFWQYHCDPDTWSVMAKYAGDLQDLPNNPEHGWCLLEGWLPFRARSGREKDLGWFTIECGSDPKSLDRLKRFLTTKADSRRAATCFSAVGVTDDPSRALLFSYLDQQVGQDHGIMTSTAEMSLIARRATINKPVAIISKCRKSSWTLASDAKSADCQQDVPTFQNIIPRLFDAACQIGCHLLTQLILEQFELQRKNLSRGFRKALRGSPNTAYFLLPYFGQIGHSFAGEFEGELFPAAESNKVLSVTLLLESGAEPNHYEGGQTPLLRAVEWGSLEAAKTLLERGAKELPDLVTGFTPIMLAARNGSADMVQLLLDKGGSVNRKGPHGLTPLHFAMQSGDETTIRYLLMNGANAEGRDDEGQPVQ